MTVGSTGTAGGLPAGDRAKPLAVPSPPCHPWVTDGSMRCWDAGTLPCIRGQWTWAGLGSLGCLHFVPPRDTFSRLRAGLSCRQSSLACQMGPPCHSQVLSVVPIRRSEPRAGCAKQLLPLTLCCPASQQKHLGPWRRMTGEGSRRFTQGTGQTDLKLTGREASSEREVRNSSKQPSSPVQCSVSFPSAGDPNQHGYK